MWPRRQLFNTFINRKPTFAYIELADPADCNMRRRQWRRYGFKDVTPVVAKYSRVPSLNGSKVNKPGKDWVSKMKSINADWYILSGHHGRLYASDHGDINDTHYAGFFNNNYHHGWWDWGTQADPRAGYKKHKYDYDHGLFLRTGYNPDKKIAPFETLNPLIIKSMVKARKARCKGLILSACNTLTYRHVRHVWNTLFPDAVIFGTFSTIASGTQVMKAVGSSKRTTRAFWEDPQSLLTSKDIVTDLALQVARKYGYTLKDSFKGKPRNIGMMYKGWAYYPYYDKGTLTIDRFKATDRM